MQLHAMISDATNSSRTMPTYQLTDGKSKRQRKSTKHTVKICHSTKATVLYYVGFRFHMLPFYLTYLLQDDELVNNQIQSKLF